MRYHYSMTNVTCDDSITRAAANAKNLNIPRDLAVELGGEIVNALRDGYYVAASGKKVDWSDMVASAVARKTSIPPNAELPRAEEGTRYETKIQIINETTLAAALRSTQAGYRTLALNFANGVQACGGFLSGSRAQEEYLCRSSALFATLEHDRMYDTHRRRPLPDSTDWAILSPGVPVVRDDAGRLLDEPWLLDFITSAAPYAPKVGLRESARLLESRIRRVLEIARAYRYQSLILGAWGCGAFENDPQETARSFKEVLEESFDGSFAQVVFAITDRSEDRRTIGAFCKVFTS